MSVSKIEADLLHHNVERVQPTTMTTILHEDGIGCLEESLSSWFKPTITVLPSLVMEASIFCRLKSSPIKRTLLLIFVLYAMTGAAAIAQKYTIERYRFDYGRSAVKHCSDTPWRNYEFCQYRALWHPNGVLLDIPDEMEAGAKYEGMLHALNVFRREIGSKGIKAGEIMLLSNAHIVALYIEQFNLDDKIGRKFSTEFGLNYFSFRNDFLAAGAQDMCIKNRDLTADIENCLPMQNIYDNMLRKGE